MWQSFHVNSKWSESVMVERGADCKKAFQVWWVDRLFSCRLLWLKLDESILRIKQQLLDKLIQSRSSAGLIQAVPHNPAQMCRSVNAIQQKTR